MSTPIGNSEAQRLWCLCPACGARVRDLYSVPDDPASGWACRNCCAGGLTYQAKQTRGCRSSFEAWATPERLERLAKGHPVFVELWRWLDWAYAERVAPLDWDKASGEQRAELAARFGSEQRARDEHRRAVQDWADELSDRDQEARRLFMEALWRFWKSENRSQPKQREQPGQAEGAAQN